MRQEQFQDLAVGHTLFRIKLINLQTCK